jgi:hypothetical protein
MTTQSPCKILWTPITGAISTATAPRAFRVGDGDEPPDRRPRHRRRRLEGARHRRGGAPRRRRARRDLRARLRRARPPRDLWAPPTASGSATRSASSSAIGTRPSTSTTGMSPSAATASSSSGPSPPRRGLLTRSRHPTRSASWGAFLLGTSSRALLLPLG